MSTYSDYALAALVATVVIVGATPFLRRYVPQRMRIRSASVGLALLVPGVAALLTLWVAIVFVLLVLR